MAFCFFLFKLFVKQQNIAPQERRKKAETSAQKPLREREPLSA